MRSPFIICLPSTDVGFRRVVDQLAADTASPAALEGLLRPLYPGAQVRARELSGEPEPTWYAYRDGAFGPEDPDEWWREGDHPSGRVALDTGRITSVNDALVELYAASAEEIVGMAYQDFVLPEAKVPAEILFGLIVERGYLRSIARLRRPDGELLLCEYHAELDGAEMVVRLRPVGEAGVRS